MAGVSTINTTGFDAGQLPSIPQVLLKLIEACHKVDVSYQELADIIQLDAGLSSKIIAVANSPAYAQWNDVKDFNRLLVVLGLNTIKTIAITSAVHQFFSQFNPELGRWMGTFWRYSLTSAYSAKALARLTGYESVDEAYLAGLLHRVGQLVLLKKRPQEYVFSNVRIFCAQFHKAHTDLLFESPHCRRQQAVKQKVMAFLFTERGPFVCVPIPHNPYALHPEQD